MANASGYSGYRKETDMVNFWHEKTGDLARGVSLKLESDLRNQILETHDYYQLPLMAPKQVLNIVEVVLRRAIGEFPGLVQNTLTREDVVDMNALDIPRPQDKDMVQVQSVIAEIFAKMCCKWLKGSDSHVVTVNILHTIGHYNWDAKAVLAVAALSASIGGFRLVYELCFTDQLAKAIALLKQFPDSSEFAGSLKPKLEALSHLITALLDLCKSILELYEILCNKYLTAESAEIVASCTADIPVAVYWTVRSVVDCASQIYGLTGASSESLLEPWELSSSAHKIEKLRSQLVEQINVCCRFIEKKKDDEIVDAIARVLESSHEDNSKSLNILFCEKNGQQQVLFDCLHEEMVSIEDLRNKVVGLYVTDLNIVTEDYMIIQQMYPEKLDDKSKVDYQYEVVWFPVVENWTNDKYRQFESLRDQMEWLTVNRPSEVSPQVIRYLRERCNFVKKPRLVVMDTRGKIAHKDALQMMCIWGNEAYPFSLIKERSLWQELSWSISLLAQGIDQFLPAWIQEGKHICLYGGEDIEWIRRFTKTAKRVAQESRIELEMLYVGKDRARERVVRKVINVIQREKLSKALEWKLIAYFWLRLEKMCVSEPPDSATETTQETPRIIDEDNPEFFMPGDMDTAYVSHSAQTYNPILSGIMKLLSYGSSSKGWAVMSEGLSQSGLLEADGEALLRTLSEHEMWKKSEESYGFLTALSRYYYNLCNELPHCINMILPDTELKGISCAVCNAPMEKMVMYSCCADRASYGFYDLHK